MSTSTDDRGTWGRLGLGQRPGKAAAEGSDPRDTRTAGGLHVRLMATSGRLRQTHRRGLRPHLCLARAQRACHRGRGRWPELRAQPWRPRAAAAPERQGRTARRPQTAPTSPEVSASSDASSTLSVESAISSPVKHQDDNPEDDKGRHAPHPAEKMGFEEVSDCSCRRKLQGQGYEQDRDSLRRGRVELQLGVGESSVAHSRAAFDVPAISP